MNLRPLITATFLVLGFVSAAQALQVQTYGQEVDAWQAERDRAYRERGPGGLVEYDRATARRFYGTAYPGTRELDRQIRIDRAETELDTQQRADEIRYGFGRGNGTGSAVVSMPAPRVRVGDQLPREYRDRRYVVEDWRGHRLSPPRRGQQWVQVGPDYVLVNRAGVITSMERSR